MTLLILLNILLIILFALLVLWLIRSGGQNWFNKLSWETQAILDPTARSPSAEQIFENDQPLLEQNGIDLNDPNSRNGPSAGQIPQNAQPYSEQGIEPRSRNEVIYL
jgi:predicted PurR-regulated permease PerM